MLSTHKVEIVPVEFSKHPGADSLSVAEVFGFQYVGKTDAWVGVKRAAYLPPDSVIDTGRSEFATYKDQARTDGTMRVKAKKLRGIISFGLMIPVPDDTPLGEDWAERLGVTHYDPQAVVKKAGINMGGEQASEPGCWTGGKYDLEAGRRYAKVMMVPGEKVFLTEKLDGSNMRAVYFDGNYHVKSRSYWWKRTPDYSHLTVEFLTAQGVPEEKAKDIIERKLSSPPKVNSFWSVMEKSEPLLKFLRDNPGVVVFGEAFGNFGQTKYGVPDQFAAFDVMRNGGFLNFQEASCLLATSGVATVPLVTEMDYDFDVACELADGKTLIPGSSVIREGVVVTPDIERYDSRIGRIKLKFVSGAWLEKS